jgi:hypothetical protein
MATRLRSPARHIVVALPRDAAEAAATLAWVGEHLRREGDAFTLLHVRPADITAPSPAPFLPVDVPMDALADDCLAGDDAEGAAAATAAAKALGEDVAVVKLRSPLARIVDALMAYLAALPAERAASALVLGSHEAAARGGDKCAAMRFVVASLCALTRVSQAREFAAHHS